MGWQYTPYTGPLVVAAVIVAGAAAFVFRRQRRYEATPGGYVAVALSAAVCLTLVTYALELSVTTRGAKTFWNRMSYLGVASAPYLLVLYVLYYTERGDWVTRIRAGLLGAIPLVTVLLAFTNGRGHRLIWAASTVTSEPGFRTLEHPSHGPAFVVFSAYAFLLAVVSLALLARRAVRTRGVYRRQAVWLFLAVAVTTVLGVVYVLFDPTPGVNLTNLGYGVAALAVSWSVARHGLFTLLPIARQMTVEQMDDAVIVLDVEERVVDVNPAAGPFLAVPSDDVMGIPVGEAFDSPVIPADPESVFDETDVVETGDERFFQRQVSALTRDGRRFGYLLVVREVTERKRRERQLRRQNDRLEQFASVVSHDLRNPLNVIQGRISLTKDTGEIDHLDAAADATDRMERLVDDLLELARQGQQVGDTEPVAIDAIAADAWEVVDAPGATFEASTNRRVDADPGRLQQVFENLFRNAVEHSSTGPRSPTREDSVEHSSTTSRPAADDSVEHSGGTLTIRVVSTDQGFAVEDDGPGIPEADRDAVFDHGHTTNEDGTGFGLAIVRGIVEAHGWSIEVTDGIDGGARFEITIPEDAAVGSTDASTDAE